MKISIECSQSSEDGGRAWTPEWSVVDADAWPSDYNYYGVLANGCPTAVDALWCAIEQGWLIPGRG